MSISRYRECSNRRTSSGNDNHKVNEGSEIPEEDEPACNTGGRKHSPRKTGSISEELDWNLATFVQYCTPLFVNCLPMGWKQSSSHRQVPRISQLCLHTETRGPGRISRGTARHSALKHEAKSNFPHFYSSPSQRNNARSSASDNH